MRAVTGGCHSLAGQSVRPRGGMTLRDHLRDFPDGGAKDVDLGMGRALEVKSRCGNPVLKTSFASLDGSECQSSYLQFMAPSPGDASPGS